MKTSFIPFRFLLSLLIVIVLLMVCNACSKTLTQSESDKSEQVTDELLTVCKGKPVHPNNVTSIEMQIEDLNFAQIVEALGAPDIVYGTLMWLECENGCPYAVGLLYNNLGMWFSASGNEPVADVIKLDNGIVGIRLARNKEIDAIYCFTPGELDDYLSGKGAPPAYLSSKYINKWRGFGKVVPLPP